MKCPECKKEITNKVFPKLFHGKRYCSTDCYDRVKYRSNHVGVEEGKRIARQRKTKIKNRADNPQPEGIK